MATSTTQVANRALQKLNAARIDSLTDGSRNARAVSAAFDAVRDRLLRVHPWNFAVRRTKMPEVTEDPTFGDVKFVAKPEDFIRLLKGREAGTDRIEERTHARVEGKYIVTDRDTPFPFRYIARIEDPNEWDPLFAELMSLTLATELIGEIPVSANDTQVLLRELKDLSAEARKINGQESPPTQEPLDSWLEARL